MLQILFFFVDIGRTEGLGGGDAARGRDAFDNNDVVLIRNARIEFITERAGIYEYIISSRIGNDSSSANNVPARCPLNLLYL